MNSEKKSLGSPVLILAGMVLLAWLMGSSCQGKGNGGGSGILDPLKITKYALPLVIPPEMPWVSRAAGRTDYEIQVRQFTQQVLPPPFAETPVFGYGRAGDPLPGPGVATTFHYPALTVETRTNALVRVKWINGLTDGQGNYLPHLLPVDQTLHWANPPGPPDMETANPKRYWGPVPIVAHLHGAHVPDLSDGNPEAWYLPNAKNIPSGYATEGTHYRSVVATDPGAAVFEYPNSQLATTLWFHDHTLGLTRVNVYAGMAGFWLIRDAVEDGLNLPGPSPKAGDAPGTRYYEVPLAIQDRSFREDGSLFYPDSRKYFDGYAGPYVPDSNVPPIWNPEVFGNAIVVNGQTWPYLEVEPRKYRFRLLDGCNARTLILKFDQAGLNFTQVGSDGGLLPGAPVVRSQILLGPGERADVIVDFSGLAVGDSVLLLNLAPDEPYQGPSPPGSQTPADPMTTGQVMQFRVVALAAPDPSVIPPGLPAIAPLATVLPARDLTLNEIVNAAADIPIEAELGTVTDGPISWGHTITENPGVGDTEIWRVVNLTVDAHPIHLHLVQFQVLDRTPFDAETFAADEELWLEGLGPLPVVSSYFTGGATGPGPGENGWKDTVVANPGQVTRIIATFDLAGLYVWHCHILEHEDNEMMRPFRVGP